MNLKRLWCVLVIIAFSMPALAATPVQIDSFDNFDPNWVEATGSGYGSYVEQALVGGVNEVNEGLGSMKFNFPLYEWPDTDDEVIRTFSPALDFNNYKELAITLWVWTYDPNDSRRETPLMRLKEISLRDGSDRVGIFSVLALRNVGWNKVIAPLRNFVWREADDVIDPNVADWNDITKIGLWARTEDTGDIDDQNAIYIDDMQLEWAPPQPGRPYQVASCDDINDELWDELRDSGTMSQSDSNFTEGTGSMMIDFTLYGLPKPDITPAFTFIPALDFTDGNDWAITWWVWTDLVNDSGLHEMILHDVADNIGRYRVPTPATSGWNKVTARIDEFLWEPGTGPGGGVPKMTADEACLDTILFIEMWTHCYPVAGNEIYLDDLRIEPAVEALSEATVYNADYGTITVDGNASDWADLVDSDIIDIDLTAVPNQPRGDLHVKYRLAWDYDYLYILVEEQPGDTEATEAPDLDTFSWGAMDGETQYDSLGLWFDFTNNRLSGHKIHLSFWLFLGLSSTGQNDLMVAWTNATWYNHQDAAIADGNVATSGAWVSATETTRVIEARVKWSDLDSEIDSWFQPVGGIAAAVQPGYIFGSDPRLHDREDTPGHNWTAAHGAAWFTGWMWDDRPEHPGDFMPTGRDTFSTDIRLVCSAGDLDFDCDVDFVDYAQFAAEWYGTDCNNLNDFCNGADIVTPMDGKVDPNDLGRFALRWLLP